MKKFREVRNQVTEGFLRDYGRMVGQMAGKLLEPSIHSPSPMIDMRKNKSYGSNVAGIYVRHNRDPNNIVRFTGRNAHQNAQNYIRQNRDYSLMEEAGVYTAAQKLALMNDKRRAETLMALNRLKKTGDINKLTPRHREIVTRFLTKTGGLDRVNRGIATRTLRMYSKMED